MNFLKYPSEFEELPLMLRIHHLKIFLNDMRQEDIDTFLLNTAIFYLNNIKLMAKRHLCKEEYEALFFCITYSDLERIDREEFHIPNLCITKIKYAKSIKNRTPLNVKEYGWLDNALQNLNNENKFNVVYSQFTDESDYEVFRIYLLDKS